MHFGNHSGGESSVTARQNEEKSGGEYFSENGKVLMKQLFQILLLDEGKHCWII